MHHLQRSLTMSFIALYQFETGYVLRHYNIVSFTVSEENEGTENTSATCVELQRELVRQEIETGKTQNLLHLDEARGNVMREMCMYCSSTSCVLFNETLPACLRAFGQPRMKNHIRRKGDYRSFYTILNRRGL